MRLKFTIHAQVRIHERSLSIERIKQVVSKPDKKTDAGEGKIKVRKKFGTKELVVVYVRDGFRDRRDDYFIITAYENQLR